MVKTLQTFFFFFVRRASFNRFFYRKKGSDSAKKWLVLTERHGSLDGSVASYPEGRGLEL